MTSASAPPTTTAAIPAVGCISGLSSTPDRRLRTTRRRSNEICASILWVQAIRAALYGFGTVVLGTALADSGLSDTQVGLVFTAMLAGMALATVAVGVLGDRIGRRRLYTCCWWRSGSSARRSR